MYEMNENIIVNDKNTHYRGVKDADESNNWRNDIHTYGRSLGKCQSWHIKNHRYVRDQRKSV